MDLAELGKIVDEYHYARASRLAADKDAAKLKTVEDALKLTIITECKANKLSAVGGDIALVKYTVKDRPIATDWPDVHKYMVEHDAMDLMQKRLHEGACKLRWDDKVEIPGVGHLDVDALSIGAAPK
jgi:hypothetical protein